MLVTSTHVAQLNTQYNLIGSKKSTFNLGFQARSGIFWNGRQTGELKSPKPLLLFSQVQDRIDWFRLSTSLKCVLSLFTADIHKQQVVLIQTMLLLSDYLCATTIRQIYVKNIAPLTDEGGASCPFSLKFKVVTISRVTGGKCYLAADNRVYSTLVVLCLLAPPPPQIFPKMSRLSIGKVEWREKNLARKKINSLFYYS